MPGWDQVPADSAASGDKLLAVKGDGAFVRLEVDDTLATGGFALLTQLDARTARGASAVGATASLDMGNVSAGVRIAILAIFAGSASGSSDLTISVNGTVVKTQSLRAFAYGFAGGDSGSDPQYAIPAAVVPYIHTSAAGDVTISMTAPAGPVTLLAFQLLN